MKTATIKVFNDNGSIYEADPHVLLTTLIAHRIIPNIDFSENTVGIDYNENGENQLFLDLDEPKFLGTFYNQIQKGIDETQATQKQLTDKAMAFDANKPGCLLSSIIAFVFGVAGTGLIVAGLI